MQSSHVFLASAHSPCLCRLPRRRGRRPGRVCRRRCAPAGEPVASSSHPETQGGGKVREVDLLKSPRGKKLWQKLKQTIERHVRTQARLQ